MAETRLDKILHSVAMRMRTEFEMSGGFTHRGEKGAARESILERFLNSYLPGNVQALHSGEVVSVSGLVSNQCDIIICDRSTPPLLDMDSYRIVPSECVYGVVEVKSRLDKKDLLDACDKIRSVKALPKSAYYDQIFQAQYELYGKTYEYFPTMGMIFAFDSIDLEILGNHFAEWCAQYPIEERPDSVWVLGKGYLTWIDGELHPQVWAQPGDQFKLMDLMPNSGDDVLFPFVLYLNMSFAAAQMNPVRLLDYAGTSPMGYAKRQWKIFNEESEEGDDSASVL